MTRDALHEALERLVDEWASDDAAIWKDQVPWLSRTEVVSRLRALAAEPVVPDEPEIAALPGLRSALLYGDHAYRHKHDFRPICSTPGCMMSFEQVVDRALSRPVEADLPERDVLAWLIERGQPEGVDPPQWWGVTDSRTGAYGWVDSAFAADQFATRGEAEAVIARFDLPNHPFRARAVQHGFTRFYAAATPEADLRGAGLDVERLARALRVLGDIDYPIDWANWLAGEGTASAAMAGMMAAEAIAAEYARLASQDIAEYRAAVLAIVEGKE